ncbi:hypothetical protein M3Y97_00402200 [Aphelenchoides bicaudatus]|nr:hypothetical protein M3Y97_00402200 [Aphelenchoides bicaudatus]
MIKKIRRQNSSLSRLYVKPRCLRLSKSVNIFKFCERRMANYNPNFEQIGNSLVQVYYSKFDVQDGQTRAMNLQELYDPESSIMTFEGVQVRGRQAILEKFSALPFRSIQRAVTKVDSQPLADGSIAISVFGQLKTDEDPINSYTQFFILKPNAAGTFYIANEIFRLVLHDMKMKTTQKQATRGQAQVYKENQETIRFYSIGSVIGTGLYILAHTLFFESNGWKAWVGFSASILFEALGVGFDGFKYYKDTVILCVIVQLLALISSYFLLLLFIFPVYGFYQLWVRVLGPWFFAPAPEEDPMDEKRQRRRQKVVYRR